MTVPRHPRDRLTPQLSFLDATMLVVSSVIGVGIFLTPGSVAAQLPAPAAILAAWTLGGVLSLAGALANAELGAMYPHAGGDYVYLREAYHPAAGFLAGWVSFFVIYAGTVATLAVGFAEGLAFFVPLEHGGKVVVAVLITIATSVINYVGVRTGARFNNVTAVIKLAALAGVALLGPLLGGGSWAHFTPFWPAEGSITWSGFGGAMSGVLFSYLGWNASVSVASEIRDPHRNVPGSLFVGLAVCAAIYLAMNLAYLLALPLDALRGARAGEAAALVFFGHAGGAIAALLILASVVSCLNATILVGPRIAYAMAIDGLFFPAAERVHDRFQTPHVAIVAQAATAIALIVLLQRFPSVLDYTTFAIVLATMADTTALYALRRRAPHHPRPYRAWGYPWVPALYLLANLLIARAMVLNTPLECAVAVAVAASGLPFYWWWARRNG
ncbi:MAG: APC family permease [Deltaproteobacteria bacterium]|nr:APC family permease [Deltaproteobacteria bacterium]